MGALAVAKNGSPDPLGVRRAPQHGHLIVAGTRKNAGGPDRTAPGICCRRPLSDQRLGEQRTRHGRLELLLVHSAVAVDVGEALVPAMESIGLTPAAMRAASPRIVGSPGFTSQPTSTAGRRDRRGEDVGHRYGLEPSRRQGERPRRLKKPHVVGTATVDEADVGDLGIAGVAESVALRWDRDWRRGSDRAGACSSGPRTRPPTWWSRTRLPYRVKPTSLPSESRGLLRYFTPARPTPLKEGREDVGIEGPAVRTGKVMLVRVPEREGNIHRA